MVGSRTGTASAPRRTASACAKPRRPSSRSGSRTVDRRGRRQRGRRDVVEPGDRDGARHVDPERGQPLERAQREQVVRARDRGERDAGIEQDVDAERPAAGVEPGPHDQPLVVRDARRLEPAPVAGQPLAGDEQRRRAGEERDPPVAQADERADHRRDPRGVVDADLGLAARVRREVDDRRAVGAHRREVAVHLVVAHRVVQAAAGEHDGRRADRAQQPDDLASRSASRSELQVITR